MSHVTCQMKRIRGTSKTSSQEAWFQDSGLRTQETGELTGESCKDVGMPPVARGLNGPPNGDSPHREWTLESPTHDVTMPRRHDATTSRVTTSPRLHDVNGPSREYDVFT